MPHEAVAHLGSLLVELSLPESQSLKDKRRVLRSITEKIRSRFNVSIAEISLLDKRQRSLCGVASIGNDPRLLNRVMNQVLDAITVDPRVTVLDSRIEIL